MAADDAARPDDDTPEADPWADIIAESLAGDGDATERDDGARDDAAAADATNEGGPSDGADVSDGFDDLVAVTGAVSTVEIGTGFSGIEPGESAVISEVSVSAVAEPADADDPWNVIPDPDRPAVGAVPTHGLPPVSGRLADGAGGPSRGRPERSPATGRLGRIVGILLGAALAIPIVFGILLGLLWLGWPDTVGIRGGLPPSLGFLLPPPPRPAIVPVAPGPPLSSPGPRSLDDVAGMTPRTDAAETAAGLSIAAETAAGLSIAAETAAGMAPEDIPEPADGLPGEFGLLAVAGPAVLEPPAAALALDTEALDAAAARARAALTQVAASDEFTSLPAKRRLSTWYRALARVGEELVVLEQAAADAGQPLVATPAAVVAVHADIAEQPRVGEELGRLGRMWMEASSRDSDGIVAIGSFITARRAGPWWISTLELANADGTTRAVSVVSRSLPDVPGGARVVVTGMLFDGGVLWAGDIRPAAAGDRRREAVVDPFATPAADPRSLPGS